MKDRVLIITYDDLGVESIFDLSDFEKQRQDQLFAVLSDEEYVDPFPDMFSIKMRARYNTHRNSKIIGVKFLEEYTDDVICDNWKRCIREQAERIGMEIPI